MNPFNRRAFTHAFSLLHVDHVRLDKKRNYSHVISPYFRIYYIDAGDGQIIGAREKIVLEPGFLYMVPSFTLCHLKCPDYLSQYFLHLFEYSAEGISLFEYRREVMKVRADQRDIAAFKRLLEINPGRGINRSDNPKVYEKNVYYEHYQELNNLVSDAVYYETQGIIFQLISRFLESVRSAAGRSAHVPPKILDSMNYVQLHLSEELTVRSLAKRVNLNEDHFSRLFFKSTGKRPASYICSKRIELAQYLTATTNYSFAEIAERAGFENVPYFFKMFKKVTTLTPGEYRKRHELFSYAGDKI